ncbi:MAG: SIR2 family protein, partial [Planctomycetales bacterium]
MLDEFDAGKVVVFAGAGVSTENRNVLKQTFYESIAAELGERSSQKAFPELMSQFCGQPNGRLQLLERILAWFQHIHSFRELEFTATAFHRSVSTLFMLDTIITTNWDTYFEDVCGAIPFVTDSDLAFWDSPQRKVLKIHGSVQNYGSIVATSEDYRGCESRLHTELIGSVLKTILATKTVIFVGYSLTDSDFQNVFAFVAKHMKGLNRQAYVINPFDSECRRFAEMGLIPIQTAASYFFDSVKAHYVESGRMYSDEIYGEAADQRDLVREEHEKLCERFSIHQFPQLIYALAYQDGLMHGFDRVGTHAGTGEYSHPCR